METRGELDKSFERLYRLHRGEVYGAALRELGNVHDAEDVTQAAFVDAYRAILRGSRPESPRAWLLAIAENVRRRRFRAARRRPAEQPVSADALRAPELPHEQARALWTALHSLPPLQREVFLLREIRGLSYEEIAARADASVGAVQMLLFRARQALRAELEPPSTADRARGSSWPSWLVYLVGRADRSLLTPRGAGALGAAALVLGGSTAGPVEPRPDPATRAPAPSRIAVPNAWEEVRAAPVAERARVARPVMRPVAPQGPATPAAPVSPPASAAPVSEPKLAAAQPALATAAERPAEVEAPVPEAPTLETRPAEVAAALPAPLDPPPLPPVVPEPPPVEPTLPPVEPMLPPVEPTLPVDLPPVDLPPLPPVTPPLQPPPITPPAALP